MRTSGILMPISSLPSPYGIGTMGKEARRFVDFLEKGGQTYWQILPICPTSYGDSPYQSFSSFAGNPYFIDLELLFKDLSLSISVSCTCTDTICSKRHTIVLKRMFQLIMMISAKMKLNGLMSIHFLWH